MKPLWIVLGVVGLIILLLLFAGGSYVSTKNTLVQKNEAINQAFSQVNIVQQRRLDLIPNLVASVKGYVAEESTILTNIANARAGVLAAGSDHAANIDANRNAQKPVVVVQIKGGKFTYSSTVVGG